MNIEALSKEIGVSYKTVYRRIAKAGLVLDDLKDADGQLTAEGIQAISALFDNVGDNDKQRQSKDNDKLEKRLKALDIVRDNTKEKAISDARAEIERLKGALQAAEIKTAAAERERDLYKQMAEKAEAEAEAWKAAADRAQQIQTMQLQLLPQRAGVKGFFSRIFGRNGDSEK